MWPFKFPYTNFHELNLDWLLEKTKSNEDRISANELKIKQLGGDDPLNFFHPIGSIFHTLDGTSPADLFGGVWEQLKGRFLLGVDDAYPIGSTGGSATHTLTIAEMPVHDHEYKTTNSAEYDTFNGGFATSSTEVREYNSVGNINTAGQGLAHNNMPPYIAVYMWRRVA